MTTTITCGRTLYVKGDKITITDLGECKVLRRTSTGLVVRKWRWWDTALESIKTYLRRALR